VARFVNEHIKIDGLQPMTPTHVRSQLFNLISDWNAEHPLPQNDKEKQTQALLNNIRKTL